MTIDTLTSGLEAQPEVFTQFLGQSDLSGIPHNLQESQVPTGVGLNSLNPTLNDQLDSIQTEVPLDLSNSRLEHLENEANLPNPQLHQDGRSVANLLNIAQDAQISSLSALGLVLNNDLGNQVTLGMRGGSGLALPVTTSRTSSRTSSL